jgi:hypothetical protein
LKFATRNVNDTVNQGVQYPNALLIDRLDPLPGNYLDQFPGDLTAHAKTDTAF